jgi:hypothetical protein
MILDAAPPHAGEVARAPSKTHPAWSHGDSAVGPSKNGVDSRRVPLNLRPLVLDA